MNWQIRSIDDPPNCSDDLPFDFPRSPPIVSSWPRRLREHGLTLREMNRLDESIEILDEAVGQQAAFLSARPESVFGRKEMASELRLLSETLRESGQTERADVLSRQARTFWKQRPTEERVENDGWQNDGCR